MIQKPVLIPRLDVGPRFRPALPFIRAYSPVLRAHDISPKTFVEFIDNLCVVQAPNPVGQVANIAGMGIGFVPYHWAQLAGTSIQFAAGLGNAAISITRTRLFLKTVNEKLFGPRGLKVSIKKDPEVMTILSENDGGPLPGHIILAEPTLGAGPAGFSISSRRMAILQPCIAPLTTDVPPPAKTSNVLDQISASQIRRTTRKSGENMMKTHAKQKKNSSSSSSDSDSDDSSLISELAKVDRKIAKEEAKCQSKLATKSPSKAAEIIKDKDKEVRHLESEKQKLQKELYKKGIKREKSASKKASKAGQKQTKSEAEALKKVSRMEYIVIENLD